MDEAKRARIESLLSEYKTSDSENIKEKFLSIWQEFPNIGFTVLEEASYRVTFLQMTPAEIIIHKYKEHDLFKEQANLLRQHFKSFWKIIDTNHLTDLGEGSVNSISGAAFHILDTIKDTLIYISSVRTSQTIPIDKNENNEARYNQLKDQITAKINEGKNNLERSLHMFVLWGRESQTQENIDKLAEEINKKIKEAGKLVSKAEQTAEQTFKKIESAEREDVFAKEAEQFEKTEKEHEEKSKWFLKLIFWGGGILIVWGFSLLFLNLCDEKNWSCIISSSIGKIVITGVLITGLTASLRGYFASNHNMTVNRQRYNALQSYKQLADAAESDPENRRFVLQKATECAYSHQATGFTKQQSESENKSTIVTLPSSLAGAASRGGGEPSA